ncbi:MAG: hydrogenase maturation nickel metallochaperone HypA [Candidatus Brockarchaeota archaeon]|nr:hydrogenase maturation nickel metallochaperone HypA [Candidatus Brockarchaeota archaeon]
MHEWSVASGIIGSLASFQKERNAKVRKVEVGVGQLSGIDVEVLRYALGAMGEGEGLEGVEYVVKIIEGRFECSRCGHEWGYKESEDALKGISREVYGVEEPDGLESPLHFFPQLVTVFLRCPKCGSSDMEVVGGMDTVLESAILDEG